MELRTGHTRPLYYYGSVVCGVPNVFHWVDIRWIWWIHYHGPQTTLSRYWPYCWSHEHWIDRRSIIWAERCASKHGKPLASTFFNEDWRSNILSPTCCFTVVEPLSLDAHNCSTQTDDHFHRSEMLDPRRRLSLLLHITSCDRNVTRRYCISWCAVVIMFWLIGVFLYPVAVLLDFNFFQICSIILFTHRRSTSVTRFSAQSIFVGETSRYLLGRKYFYLIINNN